MILRVGDTLEGYCGGVFGRDSYEDKKVEAIGSDWVVARGLKSSEPCFYEGVPENLLQYKETRVVEKTWRA